MGVHGTRHARLGSPLLRNSAARNPAAEWARRVPNTLHVSAALGGGSHQACQLVARRLGRWTAAAGLPACRQAPFVACWLTSGPFRPLACISAGMATTSTRRAALRPARSAPGTGTSETGRCAHTCLLCYLPSQLVGGMDGVHRLLPWEAAPVDEFAFQGGARPVGWVCAQCHHQVATSPGDAQCALPPYSTCLALLNVPCRPRCSGSTRLATSPCRPRAAPTRRSRHWSGAAGGARFASFGCLMWMLGRLAGRPGGCQP